MMEMGKAMMGTGEAEGENRAVAAAEAAISNPLLDDVSMRGAKGVLINITGGYDMTLFEIDEAANRIREEVDADANIIFGSTFDEALSGRMRLSIVATGIDSEHIQRIPVPARQGEDGQNGRLPQGSQHGFGMAGLHGTRRSATLNPFATNLRPPLKPSVATTAPAVPQAMATPVGKPGETVSAAVAAPSAEPVSASAEAETAASTTAPAVANQATPAQTTAVPAPNAAGSGQRVTSGLSAADLGTGTPPRAPGAFMPPEPARPAVEAEPVVVGNPSDAARQPKPSFFERLTGSTAASPTPRPGQPTTGEIAPARRTPETATAGSSADDTLDIPAFLRRQGN
jgi:cell division protein FtsZ